MMIMNSIDLNYCMIFFLRLTLIENLKVGIIENSRGWEV